jgi:putative MATE family efflux protein
VIFQQLYNIADSLVAGKFISEDALAAVGNSYEITLIFIAFAFGCNIGCSVLVSQYFGAKDYSRMKSTISTTFISSAILIALLILFGTGFCGTLLQLINTPAELMADSKLYLDIYIWGLPFLFFYNIATGIFSALGDSKTPFVFLAFSSTANILVDILFVKGFGMGVAGVAWATFLCQGISCILSLIVVYRRLATIESGVKAKLFSKSIFLKFLGIAIPSTLQQSFISVGNIIIQRVINGFGSGVMAGYAASVKLNNMVISSYTTIGNGISNYSAQNNGAGKYDRIHDGFKSGIKMVWLISLPIVLLYFIAGKYLLLLFLEDRGGVAMMTGMTFLRILSPFYFVVSAKLVADGILRGTGRMKQFMTATFTDLILRVVLAIGLSRTTLGATGIWCAWPIGWTIAAVMSVFFYKRIQFGHKESAKS